MKQSVPRLIAIFLCALCISASNIASAGNTDLHIIDKQRIAEILGSTMSNIVGESIKEFTLFAIKDDALVPVPFQFNEYDLEGYVYFKTSKIDIDGFISVVDDNDKLLFMISDAGPQKNSRHRVDGTIVEEIKLQLSTGQDRFVYLVKGSRLEPDTQYVRYSTELGQVETDQYSLRVDPENALNWIKFDWDNFTGKDQGDPLDTMKIRIHAGVITPITKLSIGNRQMVAEPLEERPGPILATTQYKITAIVLGIPFLTMNLQIHRSAYTITYDVRVDMPETRRKLLHNPTLSLSLDGNSLYGAKFRTALGPKAAAVVDGKLSPFEEQLIEKGLNNEHNWIWLNSGKNFDVVAILDVPTDQHLPLGFFLKDDADVVDKPERYVGQLPNIGYLIKDLPKKGFFFININLHFSDGIEGMDPSKYVEIMKAGVPYQVTQL